MSVRQHALAKDALAVVTPELEIKKLRSHRVHAVGCLEEGELSAHLVVPLANVLLHVDRRVAQVLAAVVDSVNALVRCPVAHHMEVCHHIHRVVLLEVLTHQSARSVLNPHYKRIGHVEHEIAVDNVLVSSHGLLDG